jgi:two-component system response regulator FixJ
MLGQGDLPVHVLEDDAPTREATCALLRVAGLDAAAFPSAEAYEAGESWLQAGCLILDLYLPGRGGISVLERLQRVRCDVPVIVLTGHAEVRLAVDAMRLGAFDFLEKPADGEQLLTVVHAALQEHARRSERSRRLRELRARIARLSVREGQVLDSLTHALSNKRIAVELGVGEKTVETFRRRLMRKMQADSLAQLLRIAAELGIGAFDPASHVRE